MELTRKAADLEDRHAYVLRLPRWSNAAFRLQHGRVRLRSLKFFSVLMFWRETGLFTVLTSA
jgi:hypothetical protein